MYSLTLSCSFEQAEFLSAELWEAGTIGIRETADDTGVTLIAAFETNQTRPELLQQFAVYRPEWTQEADTDWVQYTRDAWPGREVGRYLYLAAPWCTEATPAGRIRILHNPGLACGTGEHPCTQLALMALEQFVRPGFTVVDIGSGSGLLAIAAKKLGAAQVWAVDTDLASLTASVENFALNGLPAPLIAGSCDAMSSNVGDIVVANISASVLLSLREDLLRITRLDGCLILTGFPEWETPYLQKFLLGATVSAIEEWRCFVFRKEAYASAI